VVSFRTCGDGHWSRCVADVSIDKFVVNATTYPDYDKLVCELCVYFDTSTWDRSKVGLIYTDSGWMADLTDYLIEMGFSQNTVAQVTYSEQGMQGVNFVSFDVDEDFVNECDAVLRFTNELPALKNFEVVRKHY